MDCCAYHTSRIARFKANQCKINKYTVNRSKVFLGNRQVSTRSTLHINVHLSGRKAIDYKGEGRPYAFYDSLKSVIPTIIATDANV